jgi:hypothetical protein
MFPPAVDDFGRDFTRQFMITTSEKRGAGQRSCGSGKIGCARSPINGRENPAHECCAPCCGNLSPAIVFRSNRKRFARGAA